MCMRLQAYDLRLRDDSHLRGSARHLVRKLRLRRIRMAIWSVEEISVSNVPMAVTMARYIRAACLSDYYINRALKLNTSSPPSPPGTSISGPNSFADPPSLLSPHS
ncbi:hypothetical protein T03_3408 [Trichinella britovi]|uniref:Uncharacterized protein n=1 Tax=Trichinella britovi TaxID=45882 RepID=A0A0V1DD45_TRIBR|nr:hypothetical protein T03_3408 [Trichinella britovi]